MDVFINGEKLNHQFEGDQTLDEALSFLNRMTADENRVILTVAAGEEKFAFAEPHPLRSKKTAEIDSVYLEVKEIALLVMESLEEIETYLARVRQNLGTLVDQLSGSPVEKWPSQVMPLREGIAWVTQAFLNIESLLGVDFLDVWVDGKSLKRGLQHLIDVDEHLEKAIEEKNGETALSLLQRVLPPVLIQLERAVPEVLKLAAEKKGSFTAAAPEADPKELIERTRSHVERMRQFPARLEQVAVNLQTGQQQAGMQSLQEIIGVLEETLRLMEGLVRCCEADFAEIVYDEASLQDRNNRLSGLLAEILESFEKQDYVLLADLLEYELSPLSEELAQGLEILIGRLKPAMN